LGHGKKGLTQKAESGKLKLEIRTNEKINNATACAASPLALLLCGVWKVLFGSHSEIRVTISPSS
jgi:hypothetical protein